MLVQRWSEQERFTGSYFEMVDRWNVKKSRLAS